MVKHDDKPSYSNNSEAIRKHVGGIHEDLKGCFLAAVTSVTGKGG